jgi:DNA-directed RNA polymerase subunit RPC12/RpoP
MMLCLVCRSPNLYTKAENLYVCNDCGWEYVFKEGGKNNDRKSQVCK